MLCRLEGFSVHIWYWLCTAYEVHLFVCLPRLFWTSSKVTTERLLTCSCFCWPHAAGWTSMPETGLPSTALTLSPPPVWGLSPPPVSALLSVSGSPFSDLALMSSPSVVFSAIAVISESSVSGLFDVFESDLCPPRPGLVFWQAEGKKSGELIIYLALMKTFT